MRIVVFILVFFKCNALLFAQQKPLCTQYINDKYIINPAFAGTINYITASVNAKQYLNGIEGAPSTQYFHFQYPLLADFMGLGFKVVHDKISVIEQTNFLITYAYQIGLGDGNVSFAIDAGIFNTKGLFNTLEVSDVAPDAAIPETNEGQLLPDASFGMFYTLKNFYLGYSVYNLLGGHTTYETTSYSGEEVLSNYHYIVGGYKIKPNSSVVIDPLVLVKIGKSSPIQLDMAVTVAYKKSLNLGLAYTTNKGLSAMCMAGFKDGQYKFGYSYDLSIPKNRATFLDAGHELMFVYSFELTPPAGKKDLNPIFYVD